MLSFFVLLTRSQTVIFVQITEPFIITEESTLTCSITDYMFGDDLNYYAQVIKRIMYLHHVEP